VILKGIIFDLDGTLGDTLPVCFAAFRTAFKEFTGNVLSNHEITSLFGASEEGIIRKLVDDRWEQCLEVYLASYDREHINCRNPFPGIDSALVLLKACGVRLAIVTGKGKYSTEISLNYFDLKDTFDVVEVGSEKGAIKPVSIQKVLDRWEFPPHQVAYIGDVAYDMQAAKEVGIIALGAAWAETANVKSLESENPTAIFTSVKAFTDWIKHCVESNAV
jgi:pyrophosphatase PpaX